MTESERSELTPRKRHPLSKKPTPKPRFASTMRNSSSWTNSLWTSVHRSSRTIQLQSEPRPAMGGTTETGLRERRNFLREVKALHMQVRTERMKTRTSPAHKRSSRPERKRKEVGAVAHDQKSGSHEVASSDATTCQAKVLHAPPPNVEASGDSSL